MTIPSYSYPLLPGPSPAPGPLGGGDPGYVYAGPPGPCTPQQLTVDQLLAVARRFLGRYAEELEQAGKGGWDILVAAAAMWSRISLAIGRAECESYPSSATGPAQATVVLSFSRQTAAAGAFTLKAGSLVRARSSGTLWRVMADVVFGALDVGPLTADGQAVGYGEEWNVLGQYIAPDGSILVGEIDTIDMAIMDPPFAERSLSVTNLADATEGRIGFLDIHGGDVDLERVRGEADSNYAGRVLAIAEGVSPTAMFRQLRRFFEGIGYTEDDWYLVETWEHRFTSFYDAPEATYPFYPDYDPTLGVYDDPRPSSRVHGRWLDMPNAEGAGILEIKDPPSVEEWGAVYDDPAETQAELATSLGTRATTAYDLTDNVVTARHSCYDGTDLRRNQLIARLVDLLRSLVLHGVEPTLIAQGD